MTPSGHLCENLDNLWLYPIDLRDKENNVQVLLTVSQLAVREIDPLWNSSLRTHEVRVFDGAFWSSSPGTAV